MTERLKFSGLDFFLAFLLMEVSTLSALEPFRDRHA